MQHTHHHTSIDCRKEDDIMPDVTVSHGGTKLSVASFTYGRVQFGGGGPLLVPLSYVSMAALPPAPLYWLRQREAWVDHQLLFIHA